MKKLVIAMAAAGLMAAPALAETKAPADPFVSTQGGLGLGAAGAGLAAVAAVGLAIVIASTDDS